MRWAGRSTWTVVALAAVTLALAGCGRKGGLDLPPQATAVPAGPEVAGPPVRGTLFDPSYGVDAPPVAGAPRKRSFVLDPLLGN